MELTTCTTLLCRLRYIAAHRDHFVRRLSGVCLSACLSVCPVVTLSLGSHAKLCFAGDTDTCIPWNAATIFSQYSNSFNTTVNKKLLEKGTNFPS